MFKTLTWLFGAFAWLLHPTVAHADGLAYVSVFSGWTNIDNYSGDFIALQQRGDFNSGYLLGGALGHYRNDRFRCEVEYTFRNNTAGTWAAGFAPPLAVQNWSGELNCHAIMANAFRDINEFGCEFITPYVGGGLGLAILDGDLNTATSTQDIHDAEFAYQGMAGLSTHLTGNLSLITEYRFFGTTESSLRSLPAGTIDDFSFISHNVQIGLRFTF